MSGRSGEGPLLGSVPPGAAATGPRRSDHSHRQRAGGSGGHGVRHEPTSHTHRSRSRRPSAGYVVGQARSPMPRCRAALEAIDDRVALVGERPVAVDSLWRTLLRSLHCDGGDGLIIVHPSWWPPSRVGVLTAAAPAAKDVAAQPRAWLLRQACGPPDATVVEIADRMVAVAGAETVAVPRTTRPHPRRPRGRESGRCDNAAGWW